LPEPPIRAPKARPKDTEDPMNHVLSTHLFVNHRLTASLLSRMQQSGIQSVEIFCARQHLDYRDRAQVNELGHWFRDSGMTLHSLHAPIYTDDIWGRSGPHSVLTITEFTKSVRLKTVDEIKRAIEIAETIPFRYLIQHIGVGEEEFDERKVDAAFTALDELRVFAHPLGVEILLENIPNQLSSAARLNLFLELTHCGLNYVFDTGHAHMNEGVEAAFISMKKRIRSTHVHDNDGKTDSHLFPFQGTIDWAAVMKLFRSCGDQFPLVLELKEQPEVQNPLEQVTELFEKLEEIR
jgi:sugar phosphate isomerase/epimerase